MLVVKGQLHLQDGQLQVVLLIKQRHEGVDCANQEVFQLQVKNTQGWSLQITIITKGIAIAPIYCRALYSNTNNTHSHIHQMFCYFALHYTISCSMVIIWGVVSHSN